jgi:C-terminal processing protease CtpA/Prc
MISPAIERYSGFIFASGSVIPSMSTSQKQPAEAAEPDLTVVKPPQRAVDGETENQVSHEEVEQLRKERLEAIKAAVTRGDYDSDDILEKALSRMLQSLEDEDSPV